MSRQTTKRGPPPVAIPQEAWRVAHEAAESGIDPLGVAVPLAHAHMAWMMHPQELAELATRFSGDLMTFYMHAWRRSLGLASEDPVRPQAGDTRFTEPVWQESATWDIVKEWYLLLTHDVQDALYDTPGLSGKERRRAAFWWRKWLNAVAPTNFFWTNPVAMRKAAETNGDSLVRGMRNFLEDLRAGDVRMTNPDDFHVGRNLATTPGAVVFRNRLLEVIHYAPTTPRVHATPIVIVTPWINKFYVLDLTSRKSLVRYLLDQGFSVFITSWKNPTPQMREVAFDDYIAEGVDRIVETARGLTGARQVHAVGYCIGGTALSVYMAWANRKYGKPEDVPVAHWTLLASLVDFQRPGAIEVFIDEGSVRWLSQAMKSRGYLDGKEMAAAFRLLRSNSLIWNYVVHGYLYGESPPPFDVLYWNMDTTRMPYRMHEYYLREMYLHNKLVKKDALMIAGQPIDLGLVGQPLYAATAEDDHIAPWKECFQVNNFIPAQKRFVLSSSGHILGIVNPPTTPPKRRYRVAEAHMRDNIEQWLDRAQEHQGTWWEDWMAWLKPRCGELVDAPPAATKEYPKLLEAPGTYVLEP